jgi:hypothetical protein
MIILEWCEFCPILIASAGRNGFDVVGWMVLVSLLAEKEHAITTLQHVKTVLHVI